MRMTQDFEAYIDEYDVIVAYMKKSFYKGKSRSFYLKNENEDIIRVRVKHHDSVEGGYTKFILTVDPDDLCIGDEYMLFNEYGRGVPCQYGHIVKTSRFHNDFTYDGDDLGVTYTKEKSIFKMWSPVANRICIQLKKGEDTLFVEMKKQEKGIFFAEVCQDLENYQYTFLIRVNGKWEEAIDPYTSFSGPNGKYSVIVDVSKIPFPKKIEMSPLESNVDAIIYEASIRDMTSQKKIGVLHPKTFSGFVEDNVTTQLKNTGFHYLKQLGVTHVQLLPVFDFGSVDELHTELLYNWGYDPMQYRCLEGSYSLNPKDASERVVEFANLVHECHRAGLKVNLDVVFNHVYDLDNFSLQKFVPNYYFLIDKEGRYSNGSYCGNDIDTRAPMCAKYFKETVKRIIEWYDIDGLRFDLMGILDIQFMNQVAAMAKEMKPGFMVYGEGWNMPSYVPDYLRASQLNQDKMDLVAHFSDRFRDVIRGSNGELIRKGYIGGRFDDIYAAKQCLMASCLDYYFDSPCKVVNYLECHDNHTLWDKLKSSCIEDNDDIRKCRQMIGNAMVLLAQGIPFLHAGQEFGRTKKGAGNTYNKSDSYNLMDYSLRDKNMDMVELTKALIQIRKEHPCFRQRTTQDIKENVFVTYMIDQVLVYNARSGKDHCICYFNPTSSHFNYYVEEPVKVIFDSGYSNDLYTQNVQIAPYSVLVCQFEN